MRQQKSLIFKPAKLFEFSRQKYLIGIEVIFNAKLKVLNSVY